MEEAQSAARPAIDMNPLYKQELDDAFDAFTMLAGGSIVTLMHVKGGYTRYTANAMDLFGFPGEYIPNGAMNWNDYLHPEDRKRYMDVMGPLAEGKTRTYDITYRVRLRTGEYANFRAVGAVLRDRDGEPSLIGGMLVNQGRTEVVDPVTILPNKNAYLEELSRRMQGNRPTLTMQVGVSKFSRVNQEYGYTYGNRVLQEISWLLQETVENRAAVFRLEGAAFALLFESMTRDEAAAIYDHIRYSLQRGVEVNGIRTILSACGGLISTFNADANAETIYSCLDYAYTESKRRMHGDLVDFNGSYSHEGTEVLKRLNTIRDCVLDDCQGFHMEYLPVVDAKTGWMNGAEAGVYWENPTFGRIDGPDFLPVLERDFAFEELGDFILRQALTDGVRFLEKDPGFLLCVDVYRMQLETGYFVDELRQLLDETGFPASQLSVNFTGDYRALDAAHMTEIIDRLHEVGVLVIIDDFGSGRDSVRLVKDVPVDGVSVDVRFTGGVETPGRDRDILLHLTELAKDCVQYVNIRGVDSEAVRTALRGLPVTTLQGRYFAGGVSAVQIQEACHGDVFQHLDDES